jgi:butyrate kinase
MQRRGQGHNLNMRAAALKYCAQNGLDYHASTLLVCHMGGGITMSLHRRGVIVDMISDDEGPFGPERAGGLPGFQLVELCFEEGQTKKSVLTQLKRRGGLMAWFGTTDSRKVEERIAAGDEQAKLVYEAMAITVAKNIAKLAPVVSGRVDAVVLTGGMAYSQLFAGMVADRVRFIAPVAVLPGENEMSALAEGALRVLRGEESARKYIYREP